MDELDIKLERPLFYKSPYGLRFEIGPPDVEIWQEDNKTLNSEYFSLALKRAISIFRSSFQTSDEIEVVYQIGSDGRKKIKKRSFIFSQFAGIEKAKFVFSEHRDIYEENIEFKRECMKRVTFSNITAADIDVEQLLTAAINSDFRTRFPHFKGECYIINKSKQIVMNLYDDRGMDVVSTSKAYLQDLYKSHSHIILDYDKEKIESMFS
ncbi:DUF3885 domain-containing protein [Alteromonas sp. MMG017]|uniref:DUF3885 domain-containing protein n=1 Tax=Alteromonas sp. MMG017 TaxID=2822692 RepID=UPI001B3A1573|nr:DUF3885 domain-containing protein [Alteromonas sp. MMG017]MBQ4829988.1 DUF3885 domain-containing protein [Alteromonas sp. MMG017]